MLVFDQPLGECQLDLQEPGADGPLKGSGGDAQDAKEQGHGIGRLRRCREIEYLGEG